MKSWAGRKRGIAFTGHRRTGTAWECRPRRLRSHGFLANVRQCFEEAVRLYARFRFECLDDRNVFIQDLFRRLRMNLFDWGVWVKGPSTVANSEST
jgi:hypothetical protein